MNPTLLTLTLTNNGFNGVLDIRALRNLTALAVDGNQFSALVFDNPAVVSVSATGNQLQHFPASVALLPNLRSAFFDNNVMSGPFPDLAGHGLKSMYRLSVSHNNLTGSPDWMAASNFQFEGGV